MESGRVRLLLREAITSAKSGNTSWARECLTKVIRADPYNEEAWLWMSAVLETTAEKRFCLEKVLEISPNNDQALAGLRFLDQQEGIVTVEGPERTICPMCGEPNDRTAFACANCGQDLFVYCPSCGERVDIDNSSCAACALEIGDSTEGAAYFFRLGQLYLEHKQARRALETWDRALYLNPDYPGIAEVAAEAFFASGQRDLALQSLQRAIDETDEYEHERELRLRLANYHREVGNMEDARRIYDELLEEDEARRERRADLYAALGRFHQDKKETDAAQRHYEMALALDENLHEIHFALAEILLEKGYEMRAVNEFRLLQDVDGELGRRAMSQVEELRPPLPETWQNRWQETLRGAARSLFAGLLLIILTIGRAWTMLSVLDLFGLLAFFVGGYFLMAATATPRNLPTPETLSRLFGPTSERARALRKQRASRRPKWLQQLLDWQTRSAQSLVGGLQVTRVRAAQQLRRLYEASGRALEKYQSSRAAQSLRSLSQSRPAQMLHTLLQKPFFRAIARFFRRIFPQSAGPSLFQRLRRTVRDSGKRLAGQTEGMEVSETHIARWIGGLVGFLLIILGTRFILT